MVVETKFHCVVCTAALTEERVVHKAVTCSKDCAKIFRNLRRSLINKHRGRCRTCNRPSSAEERALFNQWRKTLPKNKPGRKPKPKLDPRQTVMSNEITIH